MELAKRPVRQAGCVGVGSPFDVERRVTLPGTVLRYWGSYIKSPRVVELLVRTIGPAVARGWRVHLVCSQPPAESAWLRPLREVGIAVEYARRSPASLSLKTVRQVYKLCQRTRCDVFQCDNIHTSALIGAWLARVPVRVWFKRAMEPAFEEGRLKTFRDRLAPGVRLSSRLATRTVTVSEAVKAELVGLGIPAARIVVMNNPVDSSLLQLIDRGEARARLGYRVGEVVIATVGHAVPVKGWDILLKAFADVRRAVPTARLLLVGSTSLTHEQVWGDTLRAFVTREGLEATTRFMGILPDVGPALSAADMFVMPSRSEGNSNALNEAFAAGLPCISTRVGNAPGLIREGINGLLVERNDAPGLAAALTRLAQDASLRERLATGTRTHNDFPSMEEYGARIFGLYAHLLDNMRPLTERLVERGLRGRGDPG